MPDDETPDGLRVGGWVPPYSPDESAPAHHVRPAARRALPRGTERRAIGSGRTGAPPPRHRLMLAVALALGCAAAAAIATIADDEKPSAPVAAQTELPRAEWPIACSIWTPLSARR